MQILDDLPFTEIGYIRKSHGYKGHMRMHIEDQWLDDFLSQAFLFLEIDGYKVPYEIEEINDQKDLIIKLWSIENPEELKTYRDRRVFLLTSDLTKAEQAGADSQNLSRFISYHIHDLSLGDLGAIVRVDSYPQQEMAILQIDDKDVLIPLHEDLITSVNDTDQILHMDLPEGLV